MKYCIAIDKYEDKMESGGPLSDGEKMVYYGAKAWVGDKLDTSQESEYTQSFGNVLHDNILDTYKNNDAKSVNSDIRILSSLDSDLAGDINSTFAGIRADEANRQQRALNSSLRDAEIQQGNEIASGLTKSEQRKGGFEAIYGLGISSNKVYDETGRVIGERPSEDAVTITKYAQRILSPDTGANCPTTIDGSIKLQEWAVNATHEKAVELNNDPSTKVGAVGWEALSILIGFGGNPDVSLASGGIIVGIEKKAFEKIETTIIKEAGEIVGDTSGVVGKTSMSGKTNIVKQSADDVNKTFPEGWNPPYKPRTKVTEYTTLESEDFVRVYGHDSSQIGKWVMKKEAIEGLTPEQIQKKYSLPDVPTHITDVNVPAGTRMRSGKVNENFGGNSGAKQYEILEKIPKDSFQKERPLK